MAGNREPILMQINGQLMGTVVNGCVYDLCGAEIIRGQLKLEKEKKKQLTGCTISNCVTLQ